MKAVIISNGDIQNYNFYKDIISDADLIICADGGAVHAYRMKITPDVIIGDLDSIDVKMKEIFTHQNVQFLKYPKQKDETDTQLAVYYAVENNCHDITMIGCLGSRFDHSFANVCLLKYMLDKGVKGKIVNENNEIYLIKDHIRLAGAVGDEISLLPITECVEGVTTKGLCYKLTDATMSMGIPVGISNVFVENEIEISIHKGLLLIIIAKD